MGDYLTEDDIPDYKLREMTERAERKEDVPFSVSQSLNEFLLQQLGLRDLPDKQMKIAEYIIGNIDDDGYLRRDLSAIADDLIFQAGQEVDEKEIESFLMRLNMEFRLMQDLLTVWIVSLCLWQNRTAFVM